MDYELDDASQEEEPTVDVSSDLFIYGQPEIVVHKKTNAIQVGNLTLYFMGLGKKHSKKDERTQMVNFVKRLYLTVVDKEKR